MGKKIGHIALLFLLLSQTFLSGFSNSPEIKSAEKLEQDLISKVTLFDEEGKMMDSSHAVNKDDVVNIQFDWSYTEAVQVGETYTFAIPRELKVVREQQGSLLGTNGDIGSFQVKTDGTVALTFHDKVENRENAQGTLRIQAAFNQEILKGKDTASIEFVIQEIAHVLNVSFLADSAEENHDKTNAAPGSDREQKTEPTRVENENEANSKSNSKTAEASDITSSKATVRAQMNAGAASEITENILTSVSLRDEDGNIIHAEENPNYRPSLGSTVGIEYTWKLENNHGYGAGSTFTFQLPEIFKVYNDLENEPLIFGGINMGTFTVKTDGTITMVFNEEIKKHSNIEGSLKLWTEFREDWKGSVEQEIVFPIKDGDTISIPVHFQPKPGPEIDKKGIPNQAYNAESIEWTVDFNKQLKKIQNAVLRDPIQTGQRLQADSIKVYKLDVQLDGSVVQGDLMDPGEYAIEKIAGSDFLVRFKAKQIDSAYRVVFVTDITDQDGTKYKNEAVLTGDDVSLPASATVSVNRGKPISKKSTHYDQQTQTITWEILYNYNEKSISKKDAFLQDFFNKSQGLISDSFEVYKVTIGEDGNEAGTEKVESFSVTPTSTKNQNGFELTFKEDIDSAYKIIYKTKATDRVFDWENITNKVVTGEGKEGEGSRDIHQQILIKANYPNHPETDYEKKTTTWGISFNNDSHLMKNVKLKDVFSNKGLTFQPDTLRITNAEKTLVEGEDYHLIEEADGFTIEFVHDISIPHFIEYQTKFDYDARENGKKAFQNKATIIWQDKDGEEKHKDDTAEFDPDHYTKGNGFKNGSYNAVTKEITWNIGLNYNLKKVENALVTDYILGNQKLVKDSIEVYEMKLNGSANGVEKGAQLTLGEDFTIENVEDKNGNPGFKINFNGDIDTPYWITYKTSLQDQLIQKEYNNTAKLFNGDKEITSLDAKVSVAHGGEYTHKSGAQNGKVIDWKVNINFGQSKVSDATLTDDPSPNQILLENSFHLYGTKIAENGTVTKDPENELKRGEDYTLDIKTDDEGKQTFEIKFLNDIDKAYILEYQSYINARNGDEITNKTSFDGKQITTEVTDSEEKIAVKITGGSGSGSGETGSLEVTKVDASTGDALKGATFTLYDNEGNIAIRTLTTGEDGKAVFKNLLYNDYILKEDKAPDGYVVGIQDSKTVKIDSKENNQITVKNKKIVHAVELMKIDQETKETLAGAVFELQRKVGDKYQKVAELTTDEKGVIFKEELEPGDYQFIEIKAPSGYQLNPEPISFKIDEKQTEIVRKTAENQIVLGAVELTKVDQDDPETVLSGAIFQLRDEKGNILQEGLTTDKNGKLIVKDLRPGPYQFVEMKAPEHYGLDSSPIPFEIKKGQQEALQVIVDNELIPGSVELIKVDHDNKEMTLAGAEFELQDAAGKVLQTGLTTNEDGKLIVKDLKPGKYQFVETKAPKDYALDSKPLPFEIEKGQKEILLVTVENELAPGAVELTKVDKDNKALPLSGAEFTLQTADGIDLQAGLKTDQEGKLIVKGLKPGKYQLVETKAPEHYLLDSTPLAFEIVRGQKEMLKITAYNELIPGSVELIKVDKDRKDLSLSGAEFKLQTAEGTDLQEGLTTNAEGKLVVQNLKPGKYQFIETKAPDFYQLTAKPIPFEIGKSQKETLKVTAENEFIRGKVELTKFDKDNKNAPLHGVEFALQDASGKTLQEGLTTDKDGKVVIEDLKPGNYQFVETKPLFGYKSNNTPITFTIAKSKTEADVEWIKLTAENELVPGSVELTKVDGDNNKAPLADAEFELQDANGKTLQEGLMTNESGKLIVSNLKPGKYQFVETKAPFGYHLDPTPIAFTIEKGQTEAVNVIAQNALATGSVQLLKVDKDNDELTLEGAEFELQDANGKTLQSGLSTNKEGIIAVKDLKPGKYQFVETKAPFGYHLDPTPIAFTIEKGQTEAVNVIAQNDLATGSVQLLKVDKDNDELTLEGAEFELQDANGKTLQEGLMTNESGKLIVSNLKPGQYQLVETKAPEHYKLDASPLVFEIVKGQKEVLRLTAVNELTPGAVELTKIDKDDQALTLPGAEFELQDKAGRTLQAGLTTDKQGKIIVDSLKPGDYQFVETEAPKGYQKRTEPVPFTIEKGQEERLKIQVTNTKVPVDIGEQNDSDTPVRPDKPNNPIQHPEKQNSGTKLPNTATTIFQYAAAGLILLLVGITLTRFRRNRQE
ncbi:putative surface anchored protein [Bacillus thermophilus]|uniref:Surface anchored protein n=1 Tax=Siminovitchia thermophila TaxID=1245522 RepID=A0ABS2R3V0_9BACI|nr:SpaA isopeptide-forming pilin-related protein [Siminovitchia thermophila]MBM7713839.1 putative surface anchored protein [Siminovitchia thermophila]